MRKLIASIMVVLMFLTFGCAGGKFTTTGAATANTVVDTGVVLAKAILAGLDVFYPVLLANKLVPDTLVKATIGLQFAEKAAGLLHNIINNNIAGESAKSVLEEAQNLINQAAEVNKALQAMKLLAAEKEIKILQMK